MCQVNGDNHLDFDCRIQSACSISALNLYDDLTVTKFKTCVSFVMVSFGHLHCIFNLLSTLFVFILIIIAFPHFRILISSFCEFISLDALSEVTLTSCGLTH